MEEELRTGKNDTVNDTDDDDPPVLSSRALAALKEFLEEQSQSLANHESLETGGGGGGTGAESDVALVTEDWRLSQFWYDPETARTVAQEVLSLCSDSNYKVACIACPTLYAYLKKIDPNISVQLLEYDERFEQYGSDFTFYDYNQPEDVPLELKHTYQVVVADPPYLSKECLEKVAQTISFLARPQQSYLLLLTGEVQRGRAAELLGLHPCNFQPRHSTKLGNEFRLFTNYDPGERLGGWELEK
ncbi:EEF1A lysine methyltransferase 1-like [Durio zibethinus]|uniref:Protein-lysine N-methyltransferase LOC111295724 n=1 Tax=Durio zibethinus TaxID=66656 RepID=A0A6P5YX59_DURZI|nr:EEF1A lysine methyltransferase 1-like [Durio zibethinus]XP_022745104.1 EEF1A lysine methyltransferase 1-like [Durio zibethinus]XP_022745105.1 EEF1A lysine methyltransferase 1-like [Durio zibethinus]